MAFPVEISNCNRTASLASKVLERNTVKAVPKPSNSVQPRRTLPVHFQEQIVPVQLIKVNQNSDSNKPEIHNLDDEFESQVINFNSIESIESIGTDDMDVEQFNAFLRAFPTVPEPVVDEMPIRSVMPSRKRTLNFESNLSEDSTQSKRILYQTQPPQDAAIKVPVISEVVSIYRNDPKRIQIYSTDCEGPSTRDYQLEEKVQKQPVFLKSDLRIQKVSACYGSKYGFSDAAPKPQPLPVEPASQPPILIRQVVGSYQTTDNPGSVKQVRYRIIPKIKALVNPTPPMMKIQSVHSYNSTGPTIRAENKTPAERGEGQDFENMITSHII